MRIIYQIVLLSLIAFSPAFSNAETSPFPTKPVKVIVPFAPGGMTDTIARMFQRAINEKKYLPQNLAVVNVPGPGGTVGSRQVKDSEPDGYSILIMHMGVLAAKRIGLVSFGLEVFTPIAQTGTACTIVTVPNNSPHKTFDDLLKAARAKPGEIIEGTNIGATAHMASLVMAEVTGTKFRYVQVGGSAKRLTSLLGGHSDMAVLLSADYATFNQSGIRALALLAPERNPAFPEVPTAKELGHDVTFCIGNWWFAPKGTPQARIDVLANALEKAMKEVENLECRM